MGCITVVFSCSKSSTRQRVTPLCPSYWKGRFSVTVQDLKNCTAKQKIKSGTSYDIKLDGKERGLCELAWVAKKLQGVL